MINDELRKYIEENVFPLYERNERGHNLEHIQYVIRRSMKFAKTIDDINYDMVYTIAAYHDIGHYKDPKLHEQISSDMLLADDNLKKFFTEDQIKIMGEAIVDHRASLEYTPRSIYGKIVSSADRSTDIDSIIRRTYSYRLKHSPNSSLENIIEDSKQHIIEKFGKNGYAKEKMYFEDDEYENFLNKVDVLVSSNEEFIKRYKEVNNIE